MKRDIALSAANLALDPLIRLAHSHAPLASGGSCSVAEVVRRLNKSTHRTIPRQVVELWLHPEPAKRREPRLGIGLLLMDIKSDLLTDSAGIGPVTKTAKKSLHNGGTRGKRTRH